ncbi:MAG: transglutaminase family protein [Rhodobacteraceae bacterium]|nr:transglutaminase family protein [Paracoccaceae bacterium]
MRLAVKHRTHYRYDGPIFNAMQQLRLTPRNTAAQDIIDWKLEADGLCNATQYIDAHGNPVHMVTLSDNLLEVEVTASGIVETKNTSGILGKDRSGIPPRLYSRFTPLTKPNQAIRRLGNILDQDDKVSAFHELMAAIRDKVTYTVGVTDSNVTAISALTAGEGVCQDHAHIFIAATRSAGIPVRYVSGYMLIEDEDPSEAHHAWVEAYLDKLGWVGFDISNGICPTDHYIRLTTGLDSRSAAPIRGLRYGGASESLTVEVEVSEQAVGQQQQQQ